jgi:serine/threonine protein kinase
VMQSNATRTVVGKHAYIPPEQFRGKATPQSDIYAMGATLYFLLTGKEPEPISTAHPAQVLPEISPQLDACVAQATAIDTDVRFKSAAQARAALDNVPTPRSDAASPGG